MKRVKSKGDSSWVLVAGGVAALGVAFLIVQYSRKKATSDARRLRESLVQESVVVQSESRPAERDESAPVIFKSAEKEVERDEVTVAREMNLLAAKAALGIRSQPYFVDATGRRTVRVRVEARPRCGVGDYEAIEGDFERNKFGALLVSLEAVKGDGAPVVYDAKSVSLGSVYAGTTIQLAVPERGGPMPASLYVCTDIGAKNCGSKTIVAIGSLLLTHYNTPDAAPDGAGKVYYSNYVELGVDSVGVSSDIDPRSDGFNEQFADYGQKLAALSDDISPRSFSKIAEDGRVLYSVPIEAQDGGVLLVNLPRDEQGLCPKTE